MIRNLLVLAIFSLSLSARAEGAVQDFLAKTFATEIRYYAVDPKVVDARVFQVSQGFLTMVGEAESEGERAIFNNRFIVDNHGRVLDQRLLVFPTLQINPHSTCSVKDDTALICDLEYSYVDGTVKFEIIENWSLSKDAYKIHESVTMTDTKSQAKIRQFFHDVDLKAAGR